MIKFSVLMPTYNQAYFIKRAIESLIAQTYTNWELIIINDGCTDDTGKYIEKYISLDQIRYIKNEKNQGIGYVLNQGIEAATSDYIAYLPSDDYYCKNHLQILAEALNADQNLVLAFTAGKTGYTDAVAIFKAYDTFNGLFRNNSLKLVQVAHKKTTDRWVTRKEWVTEDLFNLFWRKLIPHGRFLSIPEITVQWTTHTYQHTRLVSEAHGGGLNIYRQYYNVEEPVKLKVGSYRFIDEEKEYESFRIKHTPAKNGLKILLLGELAYNPERIYALEQEGHQLYGLWKHNPMYSFYMVGPIPFGNITEISYQNWKKEVEAVKPNIIYSLLNIEAIDLAYEVLAAETDIPLVWHFKEGPFGTLHTGLWSKLMHVYNQADGRIFLNKECKEWYEQFLPYEKPSFIMDGDLPKADYFTDEFSPLLSEKTGEIHTVAPGRLVGVTEKEIETLAANNVHVHIYYQNMFNRREDFNKKAKRLAPNHFHIHSTCTARDWVKEFSQYDAGWLHCFTSKNEGDIMHACWDDLNMPARMNTLAAACLPMIQKDNSGHVVAMQSHIKKRQLGIFFSDYENLAKQLGDKSNLQSIRKNVYKERMTFTFDYYVKDLVNFFREVIEDKRKKNNK